MDDSKAPVHVTDADFEKIVLNSNIPVVVDFWAAWCGPCRMIAPYVEELAKEYGERALIAKLDTDANPQVPMKYGIMGIPTLIFFNEGKEVDRMVGVPRQPKETLKLKLDKALGAEQPAQNQPAASQPVQNQPVQNPQTQNQPAQNQSSQNQPA